MVAVNHATFQGFQFPTTTPVPDEVFDVLMPQLSGAELKVLLYICRRTFGFKKPSDTISLHQIAQGITTRDGRVLDGGTGLCKRHVQRALKVLEKKNIIQVTRKVDETGLYEVNTYSLNMLDTGGGVGTISPYGRDNMSPGVETSRSGGVGTPASTTTNSKQETAKQETAIVVDVAQDLENFGITKSAATKLLQDYPLRHIKEKLEMAKGLVAAGSALVSQNPAGWLRKAIEENYSPPKPYERHRQHHSRKKEVPASREPQLPVKESQQGQTVPTTLRAPEDRDSTMPEEKKAHEATWEKVVVQVTSDLPQEEVTARLAGTALVAVTDTVARIGGPNPTALVWLERRLYGQIAKALKGVVGKDLDLQFVSCP
jgi:replication protein O